MKWYNNSKILGKYFALTAIYLIISLTFFTAHAMAVLNYDISGENDVSGFARGDGDMIKITVNADSNVSFAVGQNTADYTEIPLDGCTINNATNGVNCLYFFESSDINTNIQNIPFVLKQKSGNPLTKAGNLYIDALAPVVTTFTEKKDGNGINFTYSIVDYLASTSENSANNCIESGIGYIEIDVQGKPVFTKDITTQNCTISGSYYANFKNTYNEEILYGIVVRDRVGNEYRSKPVEISGDFRAPEIANTFQIMQGDKELTTFSSLAQVQADVVIHIEDSSLNESNVYGDLSDLNLNTAVNIPYKNISASCAQESGNLFKCVFSNIKLKPDNAELNITITATDNDGNTATKIIKKTIELKDNAGKVLYIGPSKNHCTADLTQCYLQSGRQLLQAELDATSSYNHSVIYLGIDSDKKFAICKLSDVWTCTSVYDIANETQSIDLFIAESYDDFGNMINSDVERRVIIDDVKPNLTEINFTNSNNNNNCSVAGDTLTFNIKAKEASSGLKIYLNTSAFTTKDVQTGQCNPVENYNDMWECTLIVKDFTSTPTTVNQDIMLEDLAGNKFPIKQKFDVCKGVSTSVPNVIYKVELDGEPPKIDRRTASKISVKTYVPVKIDVQRGATLMYLTIDRCIAPGMDGLNVMGTGHYFMPSYGNNLTLVLYVGHNNAQLTETTQSINCTLTARVKIGPTVFLQEERQDFTISVDTYDNPLGTIDDATNQEINTVKERLRHVDNSLDTLTKIDKIFGTICQIAEVMGVANSIMQAVKAYIWGMILTVGSVWGWTGVGTAANAGIWATTQTTLGAFHNFVGTFIWPPGYVPVPTAGIGFGVKYICMAYTCKEYDFGTYVGIAMDVAATGVGKNNNGASVGTNTYGGDTPRETSYTFSDPVTAKSAFADYKAVAGSVGSGGWSGGTQLKATYSTVRGADSSVGYKVSMITVDNVLSPAQKTQIQAGNDALVNGLNGKPWIINPYKSVYYDDLCVPAIIYNLKKEKQIDCMYLSCMQDQVVNGLPKIFCDGNYKINKCLYLDSAEYIVHHQNLLQAIVNGFGDAFKNNPLGIAIQTGYATLCRHYYIPGGYLKDMGFWRSVVSVTCGLTGSYFTIKEIADFYNSPLFKSRNMNPAEKKDYCQGVDYSEASQVSVGSDDFG